MKEQLNRKSYREKSRLKAIELSKKDSISFSRDGFDVEVTGISLDGDMLSLNIKAKKDGKDIVLDNPFKYLNPPIMVHDGTFTKRKNSKGEDIDFPNYREDAKEALKQIVLQSIKLAWRP